LRGRGSGDLLVLFSYRVVISLPPVRDYPAFHIDPLLPSLLVQSDEKGPSHRPLGTFDGNLSKWEGAQGLRNVDTLTKGSHNGSLFF
jgi:hypothetical protein